MRSRRMLAQLPLLLPLLTVLVACVSPSNGDALLDAASSSAPVCPAAWNGTALVPWNVGIILSLTASSDDIAADSREALYGTLAAYTQHIQALRDLGVDLQIQVMDDQATTVTALLAARSMIYHTPLVAIVGPSSSSVAIPLDGVTSTLAVPSISSMVSDTELTDAETYPYFVRSIVTDQLQVDAMMRVFSLLGWSHLGIVSSSDLYGIDLRSIVATAAGFDTDVLCDVVIDTTLIARYQANSSDLVATNGLRDTCQQIADSGARVIAYCGTISVLETLVHVCSNQTWQLESTFLIFDAAVAAIEVSNTTDLDPGVVHTLDGFIGAQAYFAVTQDLLNNLTALKSCFNSSAPYYPFVKDVSPTETSGLGGYLAGEFLMQALERTAVALISNNKNLSCLTTLVRTPWDCAIQRQVLVSTCEFPDCHDRLKIGVILNSIPNVPCTDSIQSVLATCPHMMPSIGCAASDDYTRVLCNSTGMSCVPVSQTTVYFAGNVCPDHKDDSCTFTPPDVCVNSTSSGHVCSYDLQLCNHNVTACVYNKDADQSSCTMTITNCTSGSAHSNTTICKIFPRDLLMSYFYDASVVQSTRISYALGPDGELEGNSLVIVTGNATNGYSQLDLIAQSFVTSASAIVFKECQPGTINCINPAWLTLKDGASDRNSQTLLNVSLPSQVAFMSVAVLAILVLGYGAGKVFWYGGLSTFRRATLFEDQTLWATSHFLLIMLLGLAAVAAQPFGSSRPPTDTICVVNFRLSHFGCALGIGAIISILIRYWDVHRATPFRVPFFPKLPVHWTPLIGLTILEIVVGISFYFGGSGTFLSQKTLAEGVANSLQAVVVCDNYRSVWHVVLLAVEFLASFVAAIVGYSTRSRCDPWEQQDIRRLVVVMGLYWVGQIVLVNLHFFVVSPPDVSFATEAGLVCLPAFVAVPVLIIAREYEHIRRIKLTDRATSNMEDSSIEPLLDPTATAQDSITFEQSEKLLEMLDAIFEPNAAPLATQYTSWDKLHNRALGIVQRRLRSARGPKQ
ncbi:hypothetical protein CAOG_07242 [Capsaspora owczarzaki ATCC 30864]|uniref:hypothetical protein n=1 Tax=Capsaspora owczarzaki (strain ATCC 30864) TaxID=595528 RepID=UPI0003523491|nr:hypothetical protein CAOG_07242 [Capsaspora owczarzaki ATCC 30864]|eukprot:XP_004343101.2 hypothetical protein CAOG_07242 [Capsaspora owczarzaki ATCC 30864]